MSGIYLQRLVENLPEGALPPNWLDFDLATFSGGKKLYEYQQAALRNAVRALWRYYYGAPTPKAWDDTSGLKRDFFAWYEGAGLDADGKLPSGRSRLDLPLDRSSAAKRNLAALLENYYASESDTLPYWQFINRMSFWMATGSGKTLVIVKLIEVLWALMQRGEIPAQDVLVLAHRDDLLEQLRRHVAEFNAGGRLHIQLHELRSYAEVKRAAPSLFREQELHVFYYRSDNLNDEQKEKIIDFRSYHNGGRWYILLDEAHKGDKEDSKRQHIYNILSRSGFLFNFSATFTDARDIVTTVANYNLSEFIRKGHGKHISILKQEARAFKKGDEYTDAEKQKIVLKALIMLAYVRQFERRVRLVRTDLYHRPLLMALVNSVNTEDADLKLFFRELVRIGNGKVEDATWKSVIDELRAELRENPEYLFENDLKVQVEDDLLAGLRQADLLEAVYNAGGPGEIEVLVRPSNHQEVAFKLKTSDDPFALVRIGDISDWLKQELSGYEINQHFSDESYFEQLNQSGSDINILLGSRSFYEGWDSNRPNVIIYINIGTGTDAKKFILQSVGRGVRIEPLKNQRKRLRELHTSGLLEDLAPGVFEQIKDSILPLESVLIFGTNREALNLVISELDQEDKQTGEHEIALEVNTEAVQGNRLLIPVYKSSVYPLYLNKKLAKFQLTQNNLELLQSYFHYIEDDRVLLALYDGCQPEQIAALRAGLEKTQNTFRTDGRPYKNLDVLTRQALNFFSVHGKEFDDLKDLEDEINHFRHIKVAVEKIGDLERRIQRVLDSYKAVSEAKARFAAGEMTADEFAEEISGQTPSETFVANQFQLDIRRIANHYYIPVLLSPHEKIDFIRTVIHVTSEVEFLHKLEDYLKEKANLFKQFEWWLFSRVDEKSDNITIPYYYAVENRIANFKPDFIFWLKKGSRYYILFVDPKGTGRTEYEHKVDGYKALFEDNGRPRIFMYDGMQVSVHVFLFTTDREILAEGYKRYWFDQIEQVLTALLDG